MHPAGFVSSFINSWMGWLTATTLFIGGLWIFPFESINLDQLSLSTGGPSQEQSQPQSASTQPDETQPEQPESEPTQPAQTQPEPTPQQPAATETPVAVDTSVTFLFPVFNQDGVEELLASIAPQMRPGDGVIVITGNNDNALDLPWLQESVTRINNALPGVKVYAMTAGLEHVQLLTAAGITGIEGVIYDYEPKFPNAPEFDYDFATTQANVREFAGIVSAAGLKSVLLPTGLPLDKKWAQKHGWDYAALGSEVDMQIIQTQTYCKSSASAFESAIAKAVSQHDSLGKSATQWMPQVTVDPNAPNGVQPAAAAECFELAAAAGHKTAMLWWSPYRTEPALEFLSLVRGQA